MDALNIIAHLGRIITTDRRRILHLQHNAQLVEAEHMFCFRYLAGVFQQHGITADHVNDARVTIYMDHKDDDGSPGTEDDDGSPASDDDDGSPATEDPPVNQVRGQATPQVAQKPLQQTPQQQPFQQTPPQQPQQQPPQQLPQQQTPQERSKVSRDVGLERFMRAKQLRTVYIQPSRPQPPPATFRAAAPPPTFPRAPTFLAAAPPATLPVAAPQQPFGPPSPQRPSHPLLGQPISADQLFYRYFHEQGQVTNR